VLVGLLWATGSVVFAQGTALAEDRQTGPSWPGPPVDYFRASAPEDLKKLFDWFAEDGRLDAVGLRDALNVQQKADGLPLLHEAFAQSLLLQPWKGAARDPGDDWDEAIFIKAFPGVSKFRRLLMREWAFCCLNGAPDCCGTDEARQAAEQLAAALGANDQETSHEEPLPPIPYEFTDFATVPSLISSAGLNELGLGSVCRTEVTSSCDLGPGRAAHEGRDGSADYSHNTNDNYNINNNNNKQQHRLAVLVTGMRHRYYPLTTFRHVVRPAAQAGYRVDYHAMLDWTAGRWASSAGFSSKWSARHSKSAKAVPNPAFANASQEAFVAYVTRHARQSGARGVRLHLLDPGLDPDPMPPSWRRYMGEGTRSSKHLFSSIIRMKNVEALWNATLAFLRTSGGPEYSHVLWIRDDAHWVSDVNVDLFRDPWVVYSGSLGSLCGTQRSAHVS
ncbi:unnamed protein product, partial [Polarella glacialis]